MYCSQDNGPWRTERNAESEYLTSRGVNIAGFMGSLYLNNLIAGNDAHRCLDTLLCGRPHFLKLQALHALIVHCGARICAGKTGEYTAVLRGRLETRGADGRYLWGPHEESHVLLEVSFELILATRCGADPAMYRTYSTTLIVGSRATRWNKLWPTLRSLLHRLLLIAPRCVISTLVNSLHT